jgi:hypothetical protein
MTQHIYLVKVKYQKEKNEIICYFENEFEKVAKRFSFFPFCNLPSEIDKEKLIELLNFYKIKNFVINENKLISKDINNLNQISNLVAKLSNKKIIVIEPERQFLIEKDWSYFDSFKIEEEVKKTDSDFNSSKILFKELSFYQALKLNESETNNIIKQAVLSNILRKEIYTVPEDINSQVEIFLENIYFKNLEFVLWENDGNFYSSNEFNPFGIFEKISEIDFSRVWINLIKKDFFNISQKTINCECCKPIKLEDENLLPSTLIEVESLVDDLFFESSSKSFVNKFHKENLNNELRIRRRKEFYLKSLPVGPIKKGQKIKVPLIDAKKLIDNKEVKLSKDHKINHFCKLRESFLSKEISLVQNIIKNLEEDVNSVKINHFKQNNNFEYIYKNQKKNLLLNILYEIPFVLTSKNSAFFSTNIAMAITSIQEATIAKFNEFSEKNGYRVIHYNTRNAFIKGYSSLKLTKNFSEELNLPMPSISNFKYSTSFR